ncbi:hypothetical protein [Nereida sp. MMG025]|uniref:hypothetical protein n=1 Tax=Nereida sp. MMG025 TaxID=2909981 RepID=UPI001F3588AB|nr:hypothetical protein [Nereida sp. MMG025]MCF6445299.1 hypothetical protein [Nereida sp. MMG025]
MSAAPAFANGALVDAFVRCTANEIVANVLSQTCDARGGIAYPLASPFCGAEFTALVSAAGEAAVNRGRAAGDAVAAQRLAQIEGWQDRSCAIIETERRAKTALGAALDHIRKDRRP